jgi:ParB family chromosome partitioning protein
MIRRIPLDKIYGNPNQPRKIFDVAKLQELAASITENGLKQPITVRADDDGKYMIVMGERRFRAHQLLANEGKITDILCHVSKVDDSQLAIDAIIENDQRVDVTPLEQARSYQRMIDEHGFDVATLAKKLGKQERRIQDRLDLLNLCEESQDMLAKGHITAEAAYWMAQLPSHKQGRMMKAIQTGHCTTLTQIKALCAAILEEDTQAAMFGEDAPAPSENDVKVARGFEAKVESIAAMLRAGIDDNVITATRKVNPDRAATLAELLGQMQKDMRRIETALRVVASQTELAA